MRLRRRDEENDGAARMLDHLYQSQCNDSYWHGVFGGLYLPHLRSAVYEHLIQAEFLADTVCRSGVRGQRSGKSKKTDRQPSWLEIEGGDFDRDGNEEVMLNSELMNLFIDPAEGGRITELDWKPRSFNLTNTLTRRHEGYHDKICKRARTRTPAAQRRSMSAWWSRRKGSKTTSSMTGISGGRSSIISSSPASTLRVSCGPNTTRPAILCSAPTT